MIDPIWFRFMTSWAASWCVPKQEYRVALDGSWHEAIVDDFAPGPRERHVRVQINGVVVDEMAGPVWLATVWLPAKDWEAGFRVFPDCYSVVLNHELAIVHERLLTPENSVDLGHDLMEGIKKAYFAGQISYI